jgi:hypothetical protein
MKLPEFDNRTTGTPLYASDDPPPFQTAKFIILAVGLPLGLVVCVALAAYALIAPLLN